MHLKKKLKNLKFESILIIALIVMSYSSFSLTGEEIHNFEDKCSKCHLVNEEGQVFEDIFIKEINFQCEDYHDNLRLSHPTGMKPTMTMPESFPLNSQGKVTCATCHKIHGKRSYLLNSNYLRKGILLGVVKGAYSTKKYEIADTSTFIDEISVQCLSCHDSSIGRGPR